jgi:Secretion system C-terminal sorting domain
MKKILLLMAILSSHLGMVAQTIELEITSPSVNKIDIYLTPSSTVTLGEVTFSIKRLTSCGATIGAPILGNVSTLAFSKVNSAMDASNSYESFAAVPTSFPTITGLSRTKIVSFNLAGAGTCTFGIESDKILLQSLMLFNGTLNVTNNLGTSLVVNVVNSANNVVLPVELLSFKADKKADKTLVQWETVQEKNLSNYIVERSDDGRNFKPIGFEKPKAKNETEKAAYSFLDDRPEIGINYYRLQSKGIRKEDFKYSKIVSVDFGLGIKAKTFPNPFTAELNVEIDIEQGVKGEVTVDMFDTSGKQVLTKKLNAEGRKLNFDVPTEGLVPGSYVIRIKNGSYTWQHKITKQ